VRDAVEAETESAAQQETAALWDWVVRYATDFVVLPAGVETIEFVRDAVLQKRIREAITVRSCRARRLSRGDWLSAIVEFDDPPVAWYDAVGGGDRKERLANSE
jgi:hypothetical protein